MGKKIHYVLIFLMVLGILDSAYLAYLHYSGSSSKFCQELGNFDCDLVNKSSFSELTGILDYFGIDFYLPIPNSVLGIIAFSIMLGINILLINNIRILGHKFSKKELYAALLVLSIISFVFGLFLVYIQEFVLRAWCLFCLIMDLIILLNLILVFLLKNRKFR